MILCGSIVAGLSIFILAIQSLNWMANGISSGEIPVLLLFLTLIAVMAVLVVIGVNLLRKSKAEGFSLSGTYMTNDKPHQTVSLPTPGVSPLQENDPAVHSYTSFLPLQLYELVKIWFLGTSCLFVLLLLLSELLPLPEWGALLRISVFLAVLLALFWAFYWCRIRVQIGPDGLRLFRGSRQYACYPVDTSFVPIVTKKSWNSIFTGTNLEFQVPSASRLNRFLRFWCITKTDFYSLIEDVNRLRKAAEPTE